MRRKRKPDYEGLVAQGLVIAFFLCVIGLIVATWYDGCGRERAAQCKFGRTILVTPGKWSTDWCIKEHQTSGYSDDTGYHDTSGYVKVRCYVDEQAARTACETGQY